MTTKTSLILTFSILGLGGGCAHNADERRAQERHEARVEERREVRAEATEPHEGWRMLGERTVEGARDRDVIEVGRREGRYKRIMIVVEHSAIEMHDVVVRFGDGERFEPETRYIFGANTRSRMIDLPGAERVIASVEFRYGNLPGGGRARCELWAQ